MSIRFLLLLSAPPLIGVALGHLLGGRLSGLRGLRIRALSLVWLARIQARRGRALTARALRGRACAARALTARTFAAKALTAGTFAARTLTARAIPRRAFSPWAAAAWARR